MLVDLGAGPVAGAVVSVLAQDPTPPPDKGPEFGKASPVGLVVILLLLIATVFLVRSMTRHLRRVPASFDPPEERGTDQGRGSGTPGVPDAADASAPGRPEAGTAER